MANSKTDDTTGGPGVAPTGKTLARFDSPAGRPTTLMVLADTHLSPTAHGTLKCFHRTKQRLEMAVADAHRADVDGVIVAGDLTKDGTAEEYALAEELLRIAPRPTLTIPGNHDVSSDGPIGTGGEFATWLDRDRFPATEDVHGIEVTGIDTTLAEQADAVGGAVTRQSRDRLRALTPSGSRLAVMHHPLALPPGPFDSELPVDAYRIQDPETVAGTLRSAGVELVISGHVHWPYAGTTCGLNVVGAPSSASFPPAYLLVHIDQHGTTVELVPLAGEVGLSEAYRFAVEDEYRGAAIHEAVSGGYFEQFPLVDQQQVSHSSNRTVVGRKPTDVRS